MKKKPTEKQKAYWERIADWEQRLEIFRLKSQGWSNNQIARLIGNISPQRISVIYNKVKNMTLEELNSMIEIYS